MVCTLGLPSTTPTESGRGPRRPRDGAGHGVERLVPVGFPQAAVLPYERCPQPVGVRVELAERSPLGAQTNPRLKMSSRSPRACVTRVPAMVSVSPQVASQSGQMRGAVRVAAVSLGMGLPGSAFGVGGNRGAEHTDR